MTLNAVRETVESALSAREAELARAELEERLATERVDVTLPAELLGPPKLRPRGTLHPSTLVRRDVEDIFLGLGYEIVDGREVETTRYNFDALGFPDWHPARSPRDIALPRRADTLLRTETSPAQIHKMEERRPPIYMVSIGRVYRRDTIDATHFPIFHQFEGLAIDKGITLADLKGTLLYVMRQLYGPEREVRFRTHYFPFTEPSMEPDVSCFNCGGAGCPVCKHSGWIEMGGSGMVDPYLYEFVGWGPEEYTGFAFGMGIERTAQLRYGIAGHPAVLGERPPLPEAVPMKIPLSWLREYVRVDAGTQEIADALSISTAEVNGVHRVGVPGDLGLFRVGHVLEAEKHPDADRLQLTSVDVGEDRPYSIVCGAWNFGAGAKVAVALPGATLPERADARAAQAARPGLRGDDPRRGRARPRHRPQRDHRPRRRARGGDAARRRAAARRRGARSRADREPRRPVRRLRRRARGRGAASAASSCRCRDRIRSGTATSRSASGSTIPRAASASSAASSATSRSASRRCG